MGFQRYANQHLYSPEVMRFLLCSLFVVLLTLTSCARKDKAVNVDEPGDAAVHYVQSVATGNYDEYIKGMVSCDSATDEYRQFQKTLLKQMVSEKKKDFDTLKSVVCVRTQTFSDKNVVNAFVKLTYSNDSVETMMIPLIWNDHRWRIR
jgi:hypothetical protein